jgi:transcription-repair coupling factor (superfamily II helicase)
MQEILQLEGLLGLLDQSAPYNALLDRLRQGASVPDQHILRAARPYVIAGLVRHLRRPTLIVTASVERAYNIAEQLPAWLPNTPILRFSEPGALFYERSPWASAAIRARLDVLSALCPPIGAESTAVQPPVVVSSALALMNRTLPIREFRSGSRVIKVGGKADPDKLIALWLGIGYTPSSLVAEPGSFNKRAGILDVFPVAAARPVRIEFWDDEVSSIRSFDPASQRSIESLKQITIGPAREALPKLAEPVARGLRDWFGSLPAVSDDVTSARPDEVELATGTAFPMIEFYLPLLYSHPANLIDYLPENPLVIVDEWDAMRESVGHFETQAIEQRDEKLANNQIPSDYPLPYLTWDELREAIVTRRPLHLGGTSLEEEDELRLGSQFVPGQHYGGQLRTMLDSLRTLQRRADRAIVISNQAQRLSELWNEREHAGQLTPTQQITSLPDELTFVQGALAEGWSFKGSPETHIFTDAEIFGWKRPEPRRRVDRAERVERPDRADRADRPDGAHASSNPLSNLSPTEAWFADLAPGDFVVHIEYGIGRFAGLRKRMTEGNEREYLVVEFAGSDVLFVPIHQADRLSRYVGVDDREPTLNRLGTPEWAKAKETARQAAEEVARELLELYAARSSVHGHAFSPDTPWQAELEASFPYVETDDQMRALRDVKADMEREIPMDRLICGDVGYGKTEVALRAAFKAVMDGKQVAILVPTTVLAQQHFNTFSQRLAAFPVTVEMLSRFRTRAEQTDILEKASKGKIDILIGTHRLLQADVMFKNLGLLVIDEEQRFGVTHKERLKQMRTEVDVLTLTATPIPRTLYMSLAGLRDISTLMTPPEARLPVLTHIGPYDEQIVRQAILRELDRDGQVFFLHNRVSTISAFKERIAAMVPEASIAIGHGQMSEDELELIMTEFARGDYDVLLCTTIIESGLDIPNANTIIIDRSDTFGLAQLYQLRGRVGRGTQRAYCYLFYPKHGALSEDSRARLTTIGEQTELGGGMSIAMRDLELRGAGDLLGTRQSGYIASVGFHLYTQLLAQAVQRLRSGGSTGSLSDLLEAVGPTITIDLTLPAYIPVDFIPELPLRLQIYRRLADLKTDGQIDEMQNELSDRFGILPPEIMGLLYQMQVRLLAQRVNATAITASDNQVSIRLPYLAEVDRPALQRFLGNETRVSRTSIWLARDPNSDDWQDRLLGVLTKLGDKLHEKTTVNSVN